MAQAATVADPAAESAFIPGSNPPQEFIIMRSVREELFRKPTSSSECDEGTPEQSQPEVNSGALPEQAAGLMQRPANIPAGAVTLDRCLFYC